MASPDSATVYIPPMRDRAPVIALVVAGVALPLLALFQLPWFHVATADGDLAVPLLAVDKLGHAVPFILALVMLCLFELRWVAAGLMLTLTLVRGYPRVKRGLFRGTFVVAWRTPWRARFFVAAPLSCVIVLLALVPDTATTELAGTVTWSWGGPVALAGLVLLGVGIEWLARVPALAATQRWVEYTPDDEPAPSPRPPAIARPMLAHAPLPTAPAVETSPFGAAGAPLELETKLVRPSAPRVVPRAPAADPSDRPHLLG
jgi:hypothetical protein